MSFAIWNEKPPFEFAPEDKEQVYQVGDKWVVTDDPKKATQAAIDAVRNQPAASKGISDGQLAAILVGKGLLTQQEITVDQG